MVIHNESILTADEALESLKKISKRNYIAKYIYSILLFILGISIIVMSFFEDDMVQSLSIGSAFIIVGVGYIVYNTISIHNIPKNLAKKNPDIVEFGITNSFTLKEESFSLVCAVGKRKTKHEFKYNQLSKIINEDDKILFLVSSSDVVICKKDSFKSRKEMDAFFYGLAKHKIKIKDKTKKRD